MKRPKETGSSNSSQRSLPLPAKRQKVGSPDASHIRIASPTSDTDVLAGDESQNIEETQAPQNYSSQNYSSQYYDIPIGDSSLPSTLPVSEPNSASSMEMKTLSNQSEEQQDPTQLDESTAPKTGPYSESSDSITIPYPEDERYKNLRPPKSKFFDIEKIKVPTPHTSLEHRLGFWFAEYAEAQVETCHKWMVAGDGNRLFDTGDFERAKEKVRKGDDIEMEELDREYEERAEERMRGILRGFEDL